MNPAPATRLERWARRSRAVYVAAHALKGLIHGGEGKSGSSMELDLLESRDSADLETAWQRVSAELGKLRTAADDFGFAAGIVVLPPREQVLGLYADSAYQKRIRALADRLGLFVVDPLPLLTSSPGKKAALFIPYDRNHPSAAGHRLIAEAIARYFKEHGGIAPGAIRVARSERGQ
jgi:hypothetical protein